MAANPYTPPRANVADITTDEVQEIRMWSASGRIGRLRYLAYTFGAMLVVGFIAAIAQAILGAGIGVVVGALCYIPLFIFVTLIMIQRSHDMGWSGWTVLLGIIIPFVGLIWMFKSGTKGENNWGAPPPPNTLGVKILGLAMPVIAIIGIVAAVALPAYQQYVQRSQAVQSGE